MTKKKKEPRIDLSQFEGTYNIDDAKKVIETLKDGIGMIATIGQEAAGITMARILASKIDVSKEVIMIGGHAGKTVLHHKPNGSIVIDNSITPLVYPESKALPVFSKPFPTAELSVIQSVKTGKQLRNERRAEERKRKKLKKKKK